MKFRMVAVSSAALLGSVAILAGCGSTSSNAAGSAKTTTGGTAVIALAPATSPNWFFPMLSSAAFSDVNTQIDSMEYRPLIMFNKQDEIDYSRSLVSNITHNSTGTQYTLTMNPKYKWSNGKPITAQDVVFTWDITKAASGSNPVWLYGGAGIGGLPTRWSSVKAVGTTKVVVTLNEASNPNWFIHNGLGQLWPVPESVWNKYPNNLTQEMKFINSVANSPMNSVYKVVDGPYHIASYSPNEDWTYVPNKNFGGHQSSLSKVVFQEETSDEAEFAGLKTGTINEGYLPKADWDARQELSNDVLTEPYLLGFNYLVINESPKAPNGLGPVFQQLYVRQALQMGVNQNAIAQGIFHGQAVPEGGPVASEPKMPYSDPATAKPLYPYNPTAGKKLLEKHGWSEVNGVMEKNGIKLEFTMLGVSNSTAQTDIQELLKADWAQEGIVVNIDQVPFDEVIAKAGTNQDPTTWNMGDWGGGWTYQPDYYPTGGGLFATNAASNSEDFNNSEEDSLITKSYEPGTTAQTLKALYNYELYTAEQVPVIFLPYPASSYAGSGWPEHAKNLHGTVSSFNPITDMIFPNYWTISN